MLDEESHTFDKNEPAEITGILEQPQRSSGHYINGTYVDGSVILPHVVLEQCDTENATNCSSITVTLPADYQVGTLAIGDMLVVNQDLQPRSKN